MESHEASRAEETLFLFASSHRVGSTILTNALSPARKHYIYWKLLSRPRESIISEGPLILIKPCILSNSNPLQMFIHNFVWVGGCLGQLRLGRPVDSLLALPFGTAWQSGRQRLTDEL